MGCICVTGLQDLTEACLRARRSFAGKRGGWQREAVLPRLNYLIPIVNTLEKNSAELDGPTQQIVAPCDLSIEDGRRIGTQINLDRR
jgi:hypothetical protein